MIVEMTMELALGFTNLLQVFLIMLCKIFIVHTCEQRLNVFPVGGGNFNRRVTGVCHLTSEIAP